MRYEWFIARRYLKPQGGATFIFHLTLISMTGVALGVASLITVLSVMNGFGNYLRSTMIKVKSHIVMNYDSIDGLRDYPRLIEEYKTIPNVEACSPMITKWGLIQRTDFPGRDAYFVQFMGVDPDLESKVTGLRDSLIAGSLEGLKEEKRKPPTTKTVKLTDLVNQRANEKKLPGIIIGKEMASLFFGAREVEGMSEQESFQWVLGKQMTLLTIPYGVDSLAEAEPTERTFVIEGVFETGHYQYDSQLAYVSLLSSQVLLQIPEGRVMNIQIRLKDHSPHATETTFTKIMQKNQDLLGWYGTGETWMSQHRIFFQALAYEKLTMNYILKIIILVATFNIIATLFMVVTEKTRDIGLLRSIGAGRKNIMYTFIALGLIVGMLGVVFGVSGGLVLCGIIKTFPISLPGNGQVYYLKYLPCDMQVMDFFWVSLYTVGISFLASLYPAIRASRFAPVDALRFS